MQFSGFFLLIFCFSLLKYTYHYNYRSQISLQVAKLAKSAGVQILIFPTVVPSKHGNTDRNIQILLDVITRQYQSISDITRCLRFTEVQAFTDVFTFLPERFQLLLLRADERLWCWSQTVGTSGQETRVSPRW